MYCMREESIVGKKKKIKKKLNYKQLDSVVVRGPANAAITSWVEDVEVLH